MSTQIANRVLMFVGVLLMLTSIGGLAWLIATDQGWFGSQALTNAMMIKTNTRLLKDIESRMDRISEKNLRRDEQISKMQKTLDDRTELFKKIDAELKRLKEVHKDIH